VQGTRDAAGVFRVAAKGTYCGFQLGSCRCAVGGTFGEQGFEFWVLDVLSALFKTLLAVDAGFDQVVEYGDRFFVGVSHFSIPCVG
jgi:hypothetical protein